MKNIDEITDIIDVLKKGIKNQLESGRLSNMIFRQQRKQRSAQGMLM